MAFREIGGLILGLRPGFRPAESGVAPLRIDNVFRMIVKIYGHTEDDASKRYSPAECMGWEREVIAGKPDMNLVSTSYIERLNGTTRLHMRRLTRLTHAFSKKIENFEAAVALHFAYYNLVRRHGTLRMTPAMFAGIERDFWTVGDLIEAAS